MDPLNPMASTLDPAIAKIYAQAASIREDMRKSVEQGDEEGQRTDAAATAAAIRQRTKRLAIAALETPARLRKLVQEGRLDEARAEWEMPRRLLLLWKKQGVGGDDVDACIEEGDAALRGEDSSDEQSSGKTDSEA